MATQKTNHRQWRMRRQIKRLLGAELKRRQRKLNISYAEVARQIGISRWSLYRLIGGRGLPCLGSLALVADWLDIALERLFAESSDAPTVCTFSGREQSLPEIVGQILRNDRALDAATAHALAEIFRVAYSHYALTGSLEGLEK